jgi:hypothetical protein
MQGYGLVGACRIVDLRTGMRYAERRMAPEIRKRTLASCTVYGQPSSTPVVDIGRPVLSLILFEKFILPSDGMKEFPPLVEAFGYGPIRTLLSSEACN